MRMPRYGIAGDRISPNVNGARYVKITPRMEVPGISFLMIMPAPVPTVMKALYKYPQRTFPYSDLVAENRCRGRHEPEYELIDTGIFAKDRYFDVVIEYAKATPRDILIRISATNRGPESAPPDSRLSLPEPEDPCPLGMGMNGESFSRAWALGTHSCMTKSSRSCLVS